MALMSSAPSTAAAAGADAAAAAAAAPRAPPPPRATAPRLVALVCVAQACRWLAGGAGAPLARLAALAPAAALQKTTIFGESHCRRSSFYAVEYIQSFNFWSI